MILSTAVLMLTAASLAMTPTNDASPQLRIVWDLHVSPHTDHVVQWLCERGWCWAIEVPPHTPYKVLAPLHDMGFQIVGQIHAHPETRAWHWNRKGMETPDIEAFINQLRALKRDETRVQFFMEDDSAGVGFSAAYLRTPPATHGEAMAMLDGYLDVAMQEARLFPDVKIWAMAGFAGTSHHYARHGAQGIIVERANDDVDDLQTAIAFARGAARQFDCRWGIDLSLWWGVIHGCVQDLPASLYTRHLWLSYISGAQVFRIEGGDLLVRPDGPTEVATAIDAFAQIARTITPGQVDAPVAVILPRDHGWMTPPYWRTANESWNYARLPYRQGDRGMDGFFGVAFPGAVYAQDPFPTGAYQEDDPPASPFSLACVTPEFAPSPDKIFNAEPPIPFGKYSNRKEAQRDFLENRIDPSPWRPMGDSRWGDIVDILTDDVAADVLQYYKVIVLLGQVKLEPVLREALTTYARAGGSIIIPAGVAGPGDEDLCGVSIQPELRVGRSWQWENAPAVHEVFRYCPSHIPETTAPMTTTLATTPDGHPLAIRHALGKGVVYTCLLPWFEAGNTPIAQVAIRLLDEVVKPLQPVHVEGPPAAWLSTHDAEKHRTVVISNNNDHAWQGVITATSVSEAFTLCRELTRGETTSFSRAGHNVSTRLTIEAHGVRVLRWQAEK